MSFKSCIRQITPESDLLRATNIDPEIHNSIFPNVAVPDAALPSTITSYIYSPQIIPQLYSYWTGVPGPLPNRAPVKIGIVSLGGGWLQSDLNQGLADVGMTLSYPITQILVDGATNSFNATPGFNGPSTENTLDLWCVANMIPTANICIIMGQNTNSGYANVINRALDEHCDVITSSWSTDEYSIGYTDTYLESALARAAQLGVPFCVSTGDYGILGLGETATVNTCYPASSPNAVAVGGSVINYNNVNLAKINETVGEFAGSGISQIFSVPSWQTGLQANLVTTDTNFNQTSSTVSTITGRAIPDVVAPDWHLVLYFNGSVIGSGGTSASSQLCGAFLADCISSNHGKRPIQGNTTVSAIHSMLYQNSGIFNNIASGNNVIQSQYSTNGGITYTPIYSGYATTTGWNAVTGLGGLSYTGISRALTTGGTRIKTAAGTWAQVSNVQVKTNATTWSNVQNIWTKTINGWSQTF